MGPLLVIGVGVLAILWILGWLTPRRLKWVAAAIATLIGFRILTTGNNLIAAALFVIAAWLGVSASSTSRVLLTLAEAREMLGVSDSADAGEIKAAHRKRVAELHPDKGGSTDATARLNGARDMLIEHWRDQQNKP